MIDLIKKNKIFAAGGVVAVFAVLYYGLFFNSSPSPSLSSSTDTVTVPASQKLIVMLTNLKTITLSDAVFKDPAFISLSDFGVSIPQQQVGRRNPFAPLPGSAPVPNSQKLPTSGNTKK